MFRGCEDLNEEINSDAVVIPSSASVRMAICMTRLATQRGGVPIMHIMFPFGPPGQTYSTISTQVATVGSVVR